jgi:hypothetical protein
MYLKILLILRRFPLGKSRYDIKRNTYIVEISKNELEAAFKSRSAYRDFLFRNFGFHLTAKDTEKLDMWAEEEKE